MKVTNYKIFIFLLIINICNTVNVSALTIFEDEKTMGTKLRGQDTTLKAELVGPQNADSIAIDSAKIKKKWKLSNTYIGGSVSWKNQEGNKESDYEFRFGSSLAGRLDKIDIKLESQYKSRKGSPNDNEQYARVNWYHDIFGRFYAMGQGQLERDQLVYKGTRLDYILLQEGVGPGYKLTMRKFGESRISVLYNLIQIELFGFEIHGNEHAFSFYIDNNYNLTKKINLSNWSNIILWDKNDIGFDIETELMYKLTKSLGLGLRHTYFLNGPTLQKEKSSDLKIYIKITV